MTLTVTSDAPSAEKTQTQATLTSFSIHLWRRLRISSSEVVFPTLISLKIRKIDALAANYSQTTTKLQHNNPIMCPHPPGIRNSLLVSDSLLTKTQEETSGETKRLRRSKKVFFWVRPILD